MPRASKLSNDRQRWQGCRLPSQRSSSIHQRSPNSLGQRQVRISKTRLPQLHTMHIPMLHFLLSPRNSRGQSASSSRQMEKCSTILEEETNQGFLFNATKMMFPILLITAKSKPVFQFGINSPAG